MTDDDIIKTARERMQEAYDGDYRNRERTRDDLNFLVGQGQWDEATKAAREAEGRPCLTINGLPQFVRQVTGQIRSMNPAIKVSPADGVSSAETADIYEGVIRQIEQSSDAPSVYEAAGEQAAAGGFGAFRIRADYCDGDTFDQEIMIERIHNPFSVYFDPFAREPSRCDAEYCFVTELMSRDAFQDAYPGKSVEDVQNASSPGLNWFAADGVTVAEYFWIEYEEKTIWQLESGQIVEKVPPGLESIRSRKVRKPKVMWAKISGKDVLEGPQEFPAQYIPVIAVTGEEIHIGDDVYRSSVIRFAKDPQRLYNLSRSAHAEVVAMQPKAPFLVTAKQISGLETFWAQANSANRPYLPYNADEKAAAPQRVSPPVPSSGLLQEIQLAAEDMKRTTGVYDASLGNRSNETSGVAIEARKQESQNGTSIYADNVVKAVAHAGRIIVSMIPRIYDTERVIRILGDDDAEKVVAINRIMVADGMPYVENDMTAGKYAVRVSVGPTYSTRRQESAEGMMAFVQAVPQAAALTGDLIAKAQDWPDADKIADRLKKALPPGIVEQDDDPQAMQAQQMAQEQQKAMQARQMQAAQAMESLQLRQEEAKARKAEADAAKAEMEAAEAQMKLAVMQQPMPPFGGQPPFVG